MLIEVAIGTAVGWLWGKLADAAEAKDNKNAIKKALEDSIAQSFQQFHEKYGDSSESFFNQEFLENHACPEILKYLTRNQQPDLAAVTSALPVNAIFVSENGFRDEIKDFFDMIMTSMKSHDALQAIINNRQIEETTQTVKNIEADVRVTNKLLEESFDEIKYEQKQIDDSVDHLKAQTTDQHSEVIRKLDQILSLPGQKGDELNRALAKQLDRSKNFIGRGRVTEAYDLLESLKEEVEQSDDYTRFRWHTNVGACFLINDETQKSAEQYLAAYNFAQDEEKAVANRIRALLLLGKHEEGLNDSQEAFEKFPKSGIIWALFINAHQLLGKEFDLSLIPDDLDDDTSVLLMLSDMSLKHEEYSESFDFARKAYEEDGGSIDTKRIMLASALSWATEDSAKAHYRQIGDMQRNALRDALEPFRDVIAFLKDIQSERMFSELTHNIISAMDLLGLEKERDELTAYANSMCSEDNDFIWHRLRALNRVGDIKSVHELTDARLDDLDKKNIFLLSEISANSGDLEWNKNILELAYKKDLDEKDLDELFAVNLFALWRSGNHDEAVRVAEESLEKVKSIPRLLAYYIRLLEGTRTDIEINGYLDLLCSKLSEPMTTLDTIQVADLLCDFDKCYEAAKLYSKVLSYPSDNYLTKRYLESLIRSDQRAQAASVIDSLSDDIRNQTTFKRIEANLARASGDFIKLESILEQEIQLFPLDSGIAAGYISTLYRLGKLDELREYLSNNPVYDPVIDDNEVEIAKYQMEVGLEYDAMLRMYSLYRSKPHDPKTAGYYILLMLQAKKQEIFNTVEEVAPGMAVYFESDGYKKTIVIEPACLSAGQTWHECISEDDGLAKQVMGAAKGEAVDLGSGIGLQNASIVNVTSMFLFASNKAHEVIAESASSNGPVWSVKVKKEDGEYDFDFILKSLQQRSKHVEHVFSVYKETRAPLHILADALGTDVITLMLEWPYKKFDLFVSSGVTGDRENLVNQINAGNNEFVIDLSALVELNRLKLLNKSLPILGRPLVPSSVKSQLLSLIQIHKKMEPSGFATEVDGHIEYQDITKESIKTRGRFLDQLLNFVDEKCDVVPVVGPALVTEPQVASIDYVGYASQDAIYLSLERDAILITEDGCLRAIAQVMGVARCTWVQPLLIALRNQQFIKQSEYSMCILDKIVRRHDFTSVSADDLLWAAKSRPNQVSPDAESAIQTFKKATLDLPSGVVVGAEFLRSIVGVVSPKILYQYYMLLMEALSFGRDFDVSIIQEAFSHYIYEALPHVKSKTAKLIIRKFGNKLVAPKPARLYLNPVSNAVKNILR